MREPLPEWLSAVFFGLAICVIIGLYSWFAYGEGATLPTWGELGKGTKELLTSSKNGEHMLVGDTIASMSRLIPAVLLSAVIGTVIGLYMGVYSAVESMFGKLLDFEGNIVPQAAMVVFLTVLGFAFKMYVVSIMFGTVPLIALQVAGATRSVHNEFIYSAKTMGATDAEVIWTILFRQVRPHIFKAIALSVGLGLGILLFAEWSSGSSGFGYRLLKLYRSAKVNMIIPYLMYFGILGVLNSLFWKLMTRLIDPWFLKAQEK